MSTGTIIVIAIAAAVVVLLAVAVARRRSGVRDERLRYEAEEHRRVGAVAQVEAERRAAEAEARAARARQEQLAAEQDRLEAEEARRRAEEAFHRADELDPDVDGTADGEVRGDAETGVGPDADPERRSR